MMTFYDKLLAIIRIMKSENVSHCTNAKFKAKGHEYYLYYVYV